jgi:hypothetical protein
MLKLVTAVVALTVMSMSAYAQSDVGTGRVQITFMKAAGEGNGNLFFDGQKYGLSINGIKIGGFRITRIEVAQRIGHYRHLYCYRRQGRDRRLCENGAARKSERRCS